MPRVLRFLVLLALMLPGTGAAYAQPRAAPSRVGTHPNIVLILTDDMGWADLGSYGGTGTRRRLITGPPGVSIPEPPPTRVSAERAP